MKVTKFFGNLFRFFFNFLFNTYPGSEQEQEKDMEDGGVLILNQKEDNINHGEWLKVFSLYKKCSSGSTPLKMFETGSNVQPLSIDEQLEQLQEFRLFSENLWSDGLWEKMEWLWNGYVDIDIERWIV